MRSTKSQLLLSTALLGAGMGLAAPALAQQSGAKNRVIEEVVVTATRRGVTDIQTTPVAVTAITATDIERMAPRDVGAIAWSVPNFSNGQTAGFNSASYSIRGVGQTDIIVYLDSPVGIVIDDFAVPHIQTQNLEMFDVEQVEILRGPQGTLFGKNTTGGVVHVTTKRPVIGETSMDARMMYGSFDTKDAKFAVNFGAGDQIAFRVAGMYRKSDGFYENNAAYGPVVTFAPSAYSGLTGQGDGRDLGGDDVFSGRAKLLWKPSDNISVLLQYEMVRDNADTAPVYNESSTAILFPVLGFIGEDGDPIKYAGVTAGTDGDLVDPAGQGHQVDIDGFYGNVDWDLGDFAIHSVTGYREQKSRLANSYTGEVGPVGLFDATRDDNRRTFQQEIRLTSNLDGPFNFVAGGFYQNNDTDFCVAQVLGFVDLLIGEGVADFGNNPQVLCNQQDARAYAVFADGTYDINERLHFTAGFRYTHERKKWWGRHQVFIQQLTGGWDPNLNQDTLGSVLNAGDFAMYPYGVVYHSKTWDEPNYRFNLAYDFSDRMSGYFNFSHGFKSGAYNDQTGTDGVALFDFEGEEQERLLAPTDPEFANSFEVGLKGESADGSFRYAMAAFYVKYKDVQRSAVVHAIKGGVDFESTRFFNAASMTVKGFEFEGTWVPAEGWMFRGNLGFQPGKYNSFAYDSNNDGVDDVDLSGRRITKAPKWQWGLDAIYTRDIAGGSIELYGNVAYESSSVYNYGLDESLDSILEAKTLLNAGITYRDESDRYFVRLIGKNLADKRYRSGSLPVAGLWVMTSYGQPRFLGVELGFNFGS